MGVAEALLALLSRGPAHGYQLRADFEATTGRAWPLNVGQVYTTLQRLERDGHVEVADDAGDRVVYRLTPDGDHRVRAWLDERPATPGSDRDELAMRVLLALARDPAEALTVIDAQRDALTVELQLATRARNRAEGDDLAEALRHDRTVLRCRAQIDWLDLAEERVRQATERGQA